jgi:hypothetical protein
MMKARQQLRTVLLVSVVFGSALACGGDDNGPGNPPSALTCNSPGVLGSARGTLTANISGFGFFNGGVSPGNSAYLPIPPVPSLGIPAQDTFVIVGVCGDGSQISFTARALTGTILIGRDANGNPRLDTSLPIPQPWVHIIQFVQVVNGAAAGGWFVSVAGGSGSVTVNSVSTSGASGSFTVTMVPNPATPAVGNKTVTGQFNVTF